MNHQTLTFIFGALLLLIGIVGGGFEVKELKLPKVGWPIRLISIIIGTVFIAISFGVITVSDRTPSSNISGGKKTVGPNISTSTLQELQDTRQSRQKHLAKIETSQANLRSEIQKLSLLESQDSEAKRRIKIIEGEKLPDLEAQRKAVKAELLELDNKIRYAK